MEIQKVKQLDELLKDFLGPNKTVTGHETTRLTAPGENYGSLMLAVKVDIENEGQKEQLETVAKLPPPGEFIQRMFNIPITFRNEIEFYQIIVPELNKFLEEKGINRSFLDCFPEFYGGRLNLNNKEYADDDAVLLLENLKVSGYEVVDRTTGFDLKTAKIVINSLAKFHAVPLAMKILKPDVFETKIRPLFIQYKVFDMSEEMQVGVIAKNKAIVEEIEDCKQWASEVEKAMTESQAYYTHPKNSQIYAYEPFATIIHTDAWVNNFMIKYIGNEPKNCKIVDFQLCEYGSPARDLVFFIFSSVQIPVIEKHYHDLIGLYHQTLTDILEKMNCDISQFSFEAFKKEIELVWKESEFFHSMIMLEPIFATKDSIKELDQYEEEDMTRKREIPKKHKERARFLVKEFINRNLI